jgi:EmrB/QacA subfamily drug resistance transporter
LQSLFRSRPSTYQHHPRRKLTAEFTSRAVFRQAARHQRDRDQEAKVSTSGRRIDSKSPETWVLALASVGSLMVALDALVVTTALSTIRLDLGASIEQLEWTVNAYTLSFAVLLMTGAALGDRFGRRRLFTAGLALFAAASAACALAPGVGWLIAARAVQGTGAALVLPLALALLSAAFPPERRAWALGIFSGVTGLAVLGGPVLGGAITEGIAWQWIFWLNVPIGLVMIVLVLGRIEESFGPKTALDIPGLALAIGAALGVVWGLVRGNAAGWDSLEVVAALAGGVVLAAAFAAWELRAREPMLPMRLFRSRAFSSGNAAVFFLTASLFGAVFFMAQFLQTAQHHGPLDAGLRLLPWTATLFVVAPIAGARIHRVGERPFIAGGLLLQAVGMGWIALIAKPDLAYAQMIAPLIIAGAGVSMALPATQSSVVNSVAPHHIGKASGTFSTMRQLGGAFGIAILVAVFAGAGSYASVQTFSDGFAAAIGVSAGLSLAGAITGLALPARHRTARATPAQAVPAVEAEGRT